MRDAYEPFGETSALTWSLRPSTLIPTERAGRIRAELVAMTDIPEELIYTFANRRAVFFIAAGCSMPSGIPSANQLAERVASAAYAVSGLSVPIERFKEDTFGSANPSLDEIAEHFLRTYHSLDRFVDLLSPPEWRKPPNRAHASVVRLAREDFFDAALTTNWDELIEAECHTASCTLVRFRKAADLAEPANAELHLFKIHGCLSDRASIIVATSQIEAQDNSDYLWANSQVESSFQGNSIVFIGYSGSISKITQSMIRVAQWSPAPVRHYVVDRCDWDTFRSRAPQFVEATDLDETRFFDAGAEDFVDALADRLLRFRVHQLVQQSGGQELAELLNLARDHDPEVFQPNHPFVNAIASSQGSARLLQSLLRTIDRQPIVRSNQRLVARVVAWVSYLCARGWEPVDGLPLLRRNGHRVYLAADSIGVPARKLAYHIHMLLDSGSELAQTIFGDSEGKLLTCVLLLASGTAADINPRDFLAPGMDDDLIHGRRERYVFRTEQEFLEEVRAA